MNAIEFKNVNFSYDGAQTDDVMMDKNDAFSLKSVDFCVQKGEFVAVLGHNGSGKSTLARLCNGLLTPTFGKISIMGVPVINENLFEVRKRVGIVFQNPDNQTVASIVEDDVAFGPENVGIAREEIGERIDFALKAVGMEEHRFSMTARLSGGQKQRIAIAGVLALKPEIIILDESTAMLDPRGRKEVVSVVKKLNEEEGITVLMITHFPEEAMLADRAIVMSDGEIVMQGTPNDVLCREKELEKYSLAVAEPIRICQQFRRLGYDVKDGLTAEEIAKEIVKNHPKITQKSTVFGQKTVIFDGENGRVSCDNLHYTYNPSTAFSTHALNGVSLEIMPGEFFGVLGHTGSGKSTFIQHLNALIKLATAEKKYKEKRRKNVDIPKMELVVNGFDLTKKTTDFRALRKSVGMVFQYPEYQLFAETVFDDVAFGLKNFAEREMEEPEIESAVRQAIEMVGLSYEQVKDKSPFELSGGQKRRVAIAGVLVTKPEILVLDEPAAGLDPKGKKEIAELLHAVHKTWCKTVIIVSHDMDEIAENCSRAAIFHDGKIYCIGTPAEIFSAANGVSKAEQAGLDQPFIAKLERELSRHGIQVNSNLTMTDFFASFGEKGTAGNGFDEGGAC